MVQTKVAGTETSDYCAKCFKDNPKLHYIDGVEVYLCGGCGYDLRTWTNFLRANGVGIRRIIVMPVDGDEVETPVRGEGIEGVEGGENLAPNATARAKARQKP